MILSRVFAPSLHSCATSHSSESSFSCLVTYFIFSHACTEMATFLHETRGLFTNFFRQSEDSSFRNELTFWSIRWRHLKVQKITKKSRCIFRVYPKKRIFFPRFRQKKWPFLCIHKKKQIIHEYY